MLADGSVRAGFYTAFGDQRQSEKEADKYTMLGAFYKADGSVFVGKFHTDRAGENIEFIIGKLLDKDGNVQTKRVEQFKPWMPSVSTCVNIRCEMGRRRARGVGVWGARVEV